MEVPPNDQNLNDYLQQFLNEGSNVEYRCIDGCKKIAGAIKRSTLTLTAEAEFLLVILTRAVDTDDGYQVERSKTIATNDIHIR